MRLVTLTILVIGAAALFGAMLLLDIDQWERFVAYFVLIPMANVCFALALWFGVHALTSDDA